MNTQEYISSGIVESYVLGLATEDERREFERMCQQFPEVLAARNAFEETLEREAIANATIPPADLRGKILQQISTAPAVPVRKMNSWKWAAAACLTLLAASIYLNLDLRKRNRDLASELENSKTELAEVQSDLRIVQNNPAVKMARLDGMDAAPQAMATIYWDTTSKDVYLLVNNLPQPASGKQYQLWAIANGNALDMGMLEITQKPLQLYRMKNVQQAEAFAITVEKKGGVPKAEGPMVVMGKF